MPKRDGRALARVIATNAERDAVAVQKMAPDPELADEVVGLHAQQAAEKYLKAVLAHRGITYRRVHSITYLLGLLEDHEVAAAAARRGARDASRRGRLRPATTSTPRAPCSTARRRRAGGAARAWAQAELGA